MTWVWLLLGLSMNALPQSVLDSLFDEHFRESWTGDSLGQNGFRDSITYPMYAFDIEPEQDRYGPLHGAGMDEVEYYLGKPNIIIQGVAAKYVYYIRVTWYSPSREYADGIVYVLEFDNSRTVARAYMETWNQPVILLDGYHARHLILTDKRLGKIKELSVSHHLLKLDSFSMSIVAGTLHVEHRYVGSRVPRTAQSILKNLDCYSVYFYDFSVIDEAGISFGLGDQVVKIIPVDCVNR